MILMAAIKNQMVENNRVNYSFSRLSMARERRGKMKGYPVMLMKTHGRKIGFCPQPVMFNKSKPLSARNP
jgi:hypothetical protein